MPRDHTDAPPLPPPPHRFPGSATWRALHPEYAAAAEIQPQAPADAQAEPAPAAEADAHEAGE